VLTNRQTNTQTDTTENITTLISDCSGSNSSPGSFWMRLERRWAYLPLSTPRNTAFEEQEEEDVQSTTD